MRRLALIALAWPLLVASACGDNFEGTQEDPRCEGDTSLPCNQDPWACPEGQTCWVDGSMTYQCVGVGPGALGDPCTLLIGGSPCGQDMGCVAPQGSTEGTCQRFCDPSGGACKACPEGQICTSITYSPPGQPINVCVPM